MKNWLSWKKIDHGNFSVLGVTSSQLYIEKHDIIFVRGKEQFSAFTLSLLS
jgi:hypothetical protein